MLERFSVKAFYDFELKIHGSRVENEERNKSVSEHKFSHVSESLKRKELRASM